MLAPRYSHQAVQGSEEFCAGFCEAKCRAAAAVAQQPRERHSGNAVSHQLSAEGSRSSVFTRSWVLVAASKGFAIKRSIERLVPVSARIATLTPPAYRRGGLPRLSKRPGFEGGFPLRCFQRLSRPYLATRRCGWRHNRYTRGTSIPVLSY